MKKLIPVFLLLVLFQGVAFSQPASRNSADFKTGSEAYQALRYTTAVKYLKQDLAKNPDHVAAQEQIADSYRNLRAYDEALKWYKELSKQKTMKADWVLRYAEVLANKENYEESERWYRKFLNMVSADKRAAAIVKAGVSGFNQDKGQWVLYFTDLNTPAAEYGPAYYKDGLIFSSNRKLDGAVKHVFAWDQTPYTDLYVIDHLQDIQQVLADSGGLSNFKLTGKKYFFNDDDTAPTSNDSKTIGNYDRVFLENAYTVSNDKIYPLSSKINSRFHEGPVVVLPEGSMMFSRNNFYQGKAGKSKKGVNKLKLYTAVGANWGQLESFPYNNDQYSVGHPTVSPDGNVLIFASDMPGGFGGTDLYYSVRSGEGKPWGKPVNLGAKINTEGNEMFPYWYKDRLFFSSTGHPGYGGLDVFEVRLKDMKPVTAPHNLGQPFNSFADDFGIIRSANGMTGYFSSNRRGNDDIYGYEHLDYQIKLSGILINAQTRQPLSGSKVVLRSNLATDTLITNADGRFFKPLEKEEDYELFGKKPGYVGSNKLVSTTGIQKDSVIQVVIEMNKASSPQQWVINHCDSLKRQFEVERIYYDLDKSFIREDAKPALDALVALMNKHPEITLITSSHCDSRASVAYNKSLSLRRGEEAKKYLVDHGVNENRIKVEYYGKSRLVNSCFDDVPCTEYEQQLNRRTEFDVILNGVNLTQLDCE